VFFTAGGFQQFTARSDASEFQYAPRVNLRYDVTDDVNVFATWAQGFRGGGFNEAATRAVNLEFASETTTNWELGTNMELLDATARVNLVLFHMTITDLQLQTTDPQTGFSEITNAGEARARGVEMDATWLPTNWLTLRGTLGVNDAEYLKFPFGPCVLDNEDSDGDGDPRCDLTGRQIHRAPRWVATLIPSVHFPVTGIPLLGTALAAPLAGVDWVGSVALEYQDTHRVDPTLDARTRQSSFFRLDGSIGFENAAQGWSMRATMRNLTDELITDTAREVALLPGHFTRSAADPRHVVGEFRWSF
jgi:outer membrane receptor protein involved in Fe transport